MLLHPQEMKKEQEIVGFYSWGLRIGKCGIVIETLKLQFSFTVQ
jgi:hypothetical protein